MSIPVSSREAVSVGRNYAGDICVTRLVESYLTLLKSHAALESQIQAATDKKRDEELQSEKPGQRRVLIVLDRTFDVEVYKDPDVIIRAVFCDDPDGIHHEHLFPYGFKDFYNTRACSDRLISKSKVQGATK